MGSVGIVYVLVHGSIVLNMCLGSIDYVSVLENGSIVLNVCSVFKIAGLAVPWLHTGRQ